MHGYLQWNSEINIAELDYFQHLQYILQTTDSRTLANYVILRYIDALDLQMGEKYENAQQVVESLRKI